MLLHQLLRQHQVHFNFTRIDYTYTHVTSELPYWLSRSHVGNYHHFVSSTGHQATVVLGTGNKWIKEMKKNGLDFKC